LKSEQQESPDNSTSDGANNNNIINNSTNNSNNNNSTNNSSNNYNPTTSINSDYRGFNGLSQRSAMALVQAENLAHHPMLSGGSGRPSPAPYFGHYSSAGGHGFGSPGQGGPMGHYSDPSGQYSQFQPVMGYDTSSPSLLQGPQPQQQGGGGGGGGEDGDGGNGGSLTPTPHSGGQWPYPHPQAHPHHPRMALEEWGQHYIPLHPAASHHPHAHHNGDGSTPPLHPHQQHYNNPYAAYASRLPLDSYDSQGHTLETSSSGTENVESPQGGEQGGANGTKQLRPPFEWMKPANVQPAPGEGLSSFRSFFCFTQCLVLFVLFACLFVCFCLVCFACWLIVFCLFCFFFHSFALFCSVISNLNYEYYLNIIVLFSFLF
jgi:hypothetical protein